MIEPAPRFVFGPYMQEHVREARHGQPEVGPGAVRPGVADRSRPPSPRIFIGARKSVAVKPVP